MKWQKNSAITVDKAKSLSEKELEGKIVTGILVDRDRPTYHEEYEKLLRTKLKV
jgi:hypothetical protein